MIKTFTLALTTAALVAGAALPAFADTNSNETDKSYLTGEVANDYTLVRLQEKGINASSVEDWNGRAGKEVEESLSGNRQRLNIIEEELAGEDHVFVEWQK